MKKYNLYFYYNINIYMLLKNNLFVIINLLLFLIRFEFDWFYIIQIEFII